MDNRNCVGGDFMNVKNICKFSGSSADSSDLFAFQFIYEAQPSHIGTDRNYSAFVCHLVTEGTARFSGSFGSKNLLPGDFFFCFPSQTYKVEGDEQFRYLYISFVGRYISDYLKSMGITRENPVCCGFQELIPVWMDAIRKCHPDNLSLMAKSMLLYAFALFRLPEDWHQPASRDAACSVVSRIIEAVETQYANPDLSFDALCKGRGYNSKYISRRFRGITGVCFSDYLQACRIRHACVLLENTGLTIKAVAQSTGYRDALYFSRIFKKLILLSPSAYRREANLRNFKEYKE